MSQSDEIDYGPLTCLIGTWQGDQGTDLAPEPEGDVTSDYYETIVFEPVGAVDNAAEQDLVFLRYRQTVMRKTNDKVFHDQVGHWVWDAEGGTVMQTLAIPRPVVLIAGGKHSGAAAEDGSFKFEVAAGSEEWPIAEAPFMKQKAHTISFRHKLEVKGDTLSYSEVTLVDIYGRKMRHTDKNTLKRV